MLLAEFSLRGSASCIHCDRTETVCVAQVLFRLIASILLWRDLARNAWVEGLIAFHGPKFCMDSIWKGALIRNPIRQSKIFGVQGFVG